MLAVLSNISDTDNSEIMLSFIKPSVFVFCCLFLLSSQHLRADEKALIVSFGAHNAEPYAILEGNQLVGGIIKDIADELADELDIDVIYVQTPRKRIERYLDTGVIHLVPISNPEWLKLGEQYRWSIPIFQDHDVLVTKDTNSRPIESLQDMRGMNLGTIRGYIYPTLTAMFADRIITRSDVRSLSSNIARLELDRIDGFIDSKTLTLYEMKQNHTDMLILTDVVISEHNIHAALSHHAPINIEALDQALKQLKERGVIEAILSQYTSL